MRLCHPFLVLLLADVASSNAVSVPTANELSKLTSPGLDQDAKMGIDGHRMLRARDEIADATGEESRSAPSDVRKLSSPDENVVKLAETLKNQLHLDHKVKRFKPAEQFIVDENPSFNIGKAEGASPKTPTKKQQQKK